MAENHVTLEEKRAYNIGYFKASRFLLVLATTGVLIKTGIDVARLRMDELGADITLLGAFGLGTFTANELVGYFEHNDNAGQQGSDTVE